MLWFLFACGVSCTTSCFVIGHPCSAKYRNTTLQAHPKVRLGRAHSKMVQRVANVGRVIKDMSGMGNRTQSMLHVDQPELDARFVYVGVHADGPTRVLCFSETKDQYTRGSNEESMSLLTSKLARLEERIKASHAELHPLAMHALHGTTLSVDYKRAQNECQTGIGKGQGLLCYVEGCVY